MLVSDWSSRINSRWRLLPLRRLCAINRKPHQLRECSLQRWRALLEAFIRLRKPRSSCPGCAIISVWVTDWVTTQICLLSCRAFICCVYSTSKYGFPYRLTQGQNWCVLELWKEFMQRQVPSMRCGQHYLDALLVVFQKQYMLDSSISAFSSMKLNKIIWVITQSVTQTGIVLVPVEDWKLSSELSIGRYTNGSHCFSGFLYW